MAFYEIRQYHIRRGKMDEWLKFFGELFDSVVAQGLQAA